MNIQGVMIRKRHFAIQMSIHAYVFSWRCDSLDWNWLCFGLILLAGCSGAGHPSESSSNSKTQTELAEVRIWLDEMPVDSRHDFALRPINRKEWIASGQKIGDLSDKLLAILRDPICDEVSQRQVFRAFCDFGNAKCVTVAISALDSPSKLVQMDAAAALGFMKDPRAIVPLCRSANSNDDNVRGNAIISLGRIGGEVASRQINIALSDNSQFVRHCAIEALRMLENKK